MTTVKPYSRVDGSRSSASSWSRHAVSLLIPCHHADATAPPAGSTASSGESRRRDRSEILPVSRDLEWESVAVDEPPIVPPGHSGRIAGTLAVDHRDGSALERLIEPERVGTRGTGRTRDPLRAEDLAEIVLNLEPRRTR